MKNLRTQMEAELGTLKIKFILVPYMQKKMLSFK